MKRKKKFSDEDLTRAFKLAREIYPNIKKSDLIKKVAFALNCTPPTVYNRLKKPKASVIETVSFPVSGGMVD